MTTAAPPTALATIQPTFTDAERVALAGFLAGYRGLTREAYALDLRQFTSWCRSRSLALFAVRRAHIEGFARELEAQAGPGRPHFCVSLVTDTELFGKERGNAFGLIDRVIVHGAGSMGSRPHQRRGSGAGDARS